jgi:hypothetical protein
VITPIVPPGRCRAARRLRCGRCLIPETNLQSISRDPLARSRFTRAIHSGRYNGPGLAVLYANRCAAHIKKGETRSSAERLQSSNPTRSEKWRKQNAIDLGVSISAVETSRRLDEIVV